MYDASWSLAGARTVCSQRLVPALMRLYVQFERVGLVNSSTSSGRLTRAVLLSYTHARGRWCNGNTPALREYSWVRLPASAGSQFEDVCGGWVSTEQGVALKTPDKLYRYHVANLRAIQRGLDDCLASGRQAVAMGDKFATTTHTRLYMLLLGVWAEGRLLKLLYEPNAFSDADRGAVRDEKALQRWHAIVEHAFRRHYKIPRQALQPPALPSTAHLRLTAIKSTLEDDLKPIVTLRNKLAHGQWEYPLNDVLDDVAQAQMDALRRENLLTLLQKRSLLEALCAAIHDLATSPMTFDRDWDKHFRQVAQTRANVARKSYATWCLQIQERYRRGRAPRGAANP